VFSSGHVFHGWWPQFGSVLTSFGLTAGVAAAADAVAGVVADATAGASVGTEMSSGGAGLDTGGAIGANFTLLSVSFAASGLTVAAVAGAAADAVAGASVDGEVSSDGAVSGTGGAGGTDSSLLLVLSVFSDATVIGAAADTVL
jgi:hypothetical protein